MAKVAATLKVMPNSPELDLDALEERLSSALPEGAKINTVEREDVAFGLIALLPTVLIPDDTGGTDVVEEAFGDVEGVESVGVENVTRI
jgi:elongation factor 1-beta